MKQAGKVLMAAIRAKDAAKVQECLSAGADVNFKEDIEGTWGACQITYPIHAALQANCKPIILLLLQRGADLNTKRLSRNWKGSGSQRSALQWLLNSQDSDLNMAALSCPGVNPNLRTEGSIHTMRTDGAYGSSIIHKMIERSKCDVVLKLLEMGADPNSEAYHMSNNEYGYCSNTKQYPLDMAVERGLLALVEPLVKAGARINEYCCHVQHQKISENEPEREGDPRSQDYVCNIKNVEVKRTPLHIALASGRQDIVQKLIELGADQSIPYLRSGEPSPVPRPVV